MEYILIFIAAVFVNNIVLAQFLGICPFLGVSKKVSTALGMTGAVTFVMILATLVTFIVQKTILDPFGIGFMQTITCLLYTSACGFGCLGCGDCVAACPFDAIHMLSLIHILENQIRENWKFTGVPIQIFMRKK